MNDRARVPFALVGVLLVLASTSLSTSLVSVGPPAGEPAVERSIERATAASQTAIRAGVQQAAREAALDPVTVRSDTTVGRQLDPGRPFVDAFKLRIYLAVRDRVARIDDRVDGVAVRVRLPAVESAAVHRALDRVHVARAGPNGTALVVRVENITIESRRNGVVVDRHRISPQLTVRTPVLAVHDRVVRFDERIDRGPLTPGLGRRLTAQLYPLVWARGYAQHYGAPVANVLANRHVALATNRGLLAAQRATLGRSDPAGRRAVAAAIRRTAVRDLLAGAQESDRLAWARSILDAASRRTATRGLPGRAAADPGPETPLRVGVDLTADRAYAAMRGPAGGGELARLLADVYSAEVRLTSAVYRVGISRDADEPPAGWRLVDERTRTSHRVTDGSGPTPPAPGDWHPLRTYTRTVRVRTETVRTWRRDNRTQRTRSRTDRTYRVGVAVVGRHARTPHAPAVPIATVHRRGAGPLDGPNLAGVADAAVRRVVTGRGGPDALARRAVAGRLDGEPVRVRGVQPDRLVPWLLADLAGLRERVRNVSVTVDRGAVGTYEVNPPTRLHDRLVDRRSTLVGRPSTYGSVAEKARVAARRAYLDRVLAGLAARAAGRRARERRVDGVLSRTGVGSLARLRRVVDARRNVTSRRPGGLDLSVDGDPPYLTLAALERSRFGQGPGRVHPLAARNVNVFATPYGDAADTVAGRGGSPRTVDLRTAAQALRAARRLPTNRRGETNLTRRRGDLAGALDDSTDGVIERVVGVLTRAGVGRSRGARVAIVRTALARWSSPAARAAALTNGSAARAIVAVAARDAALSARQRDDLGVWVRLAIARGRRQPAARPAREPVNRTVTAARGVAVGTLRSGTARSVEYGTARLRERALGSSLGEIPAGLPVAPVPGYWYATVNVWHVTVRGRYERFVVRARRGPPGETLTYVRDGRPVSLDVDGDGRRERLGRAARIAFETETAIVIAVPPTGTGVGDTDGNADERSAGWPVPGPAE